jgi:AcrR family transcriptional regulator
VASRSSSAAKPSKRRRLAVDARREELLRLGLELFSAHAYEELAVEDIAERAGISRGLLYHYFPTKREYYLAVTRRAAEEVGRLTQPPAGPPTMDSVAAGVDAFLAYAETHTHGFITAYRGAMAGDAEVRALLDTGRRRQASRILAVVSGDRRPSPLTRLAVGGWIALTQNVTAEWLQHRRPARATLRDWLIRTLQAALAAAAAAEAQYGAARRPTRAR